MNPQPTVFVPNHWLRHRHAQTLYAALRAPVQRPAWIRETWTSPDGDSLSVDRLDGRHDQPVVTLFHGLEGSSHSPYISALAQGASKQGWTVIAPNFRACDGHLNARPRLYHAGDSAEIHWLLDRVRTLHGQRPRYAAGISLGANMLLKWLGEQGNQAQDQIDRAAAIATPFDLAIVGEHLAQGFNRVYTHHFLSTLKAKARAKAAQFPNLFDLPSTLRARNLRQFDDACMAPLHGFIDAADYWQRCSSKPGLGGITLPTLLLQSLDDPFVPPSALPDPGKVSATIELDFQTRGGHGGFVAGRWPGHLEWMPERVLEFLERD